MRFSAKIVGKNLGEIEIVGIFASENDTQLRSGHRKIE